MYFVFTKREKEAIRPSTLRVNINPGASCGREEGIFKVLYCRLQNLRDRQNVYRVRGSAGGDSEGSESKLGTEKETWKTIQSYLLCIIDSNCLWLTDELWFLEADKQTNNKIASSGQNYKVLTVLWHPVSLKFKTRQLCIVCSDSPKSHLEAFYQFLHCTYCFCDFMPLGQNENIPYQATLELD